jgi:hypothetical protein
MLERWLPKPLPKLAPPWLPSLLETPGQQQKNGLQQISTELWIETQEETLVETLAETQEGIHLEVDCQEEHQPPNK